MWLSRYEIEQIGNRVNRAYLKLPSLAGQAIQRIEPNALLVSSAASLWISATFPMMAVPLE